VTIVENIASISYNPSVRKCVHRLGLTRILQSAYGRVRGMRGTSGVVELNIDGVQCLFSARTPDELRCIEGAVRIEEREMLSAVHRMLRPGDIFLDVGSNVGVFALFAAKVVGPHGTVVACEPGTVAYGDLRRNIALNQLKNVKELKLALSDAGSMKMLSINKLNSVNHLTESPDKDREYEVVRTADYDSLVDEDKLPVPRAVKIDVEGYEYSVLRGMRRTLSSSSCAALFCEIHPGALPSGVSAQNVTDLIESCGFESVAVTRRGLEYHAIALKKRHPGA
jgi:FkbM family methyltransferase